MSVEKTKQVTIVQATCQALVQMEGQFQQSLPRNIPSERFLRIAQMAVQNPMIADALNKGADRSTLYMAVSKCAQDGLVLDGREAALVTFNSREKGPQFQYMPMVAGVIKKTYNSGEILSLSAHVVYEKDTFSYELGDNEHIRHIPYDGDEPGKMVRVYAIGKLKGGGIQRVVMNAREIEKHKKIAKTDYIWKAWPEEMWEKTALRKLSKRLPQSSELDRLFQQDNELVDLTPPKDEIEVPAGDAVIVGGEKKTKAAAKIAEKMGTKKETIETGDKVPYTEPAPSKVSETGPPLSSYDGAAGIADGEFTEDNNSLFEQQGDLI